MVMYFRRHWHLLQYTNRAYEDTNNFSSLPLSFFAILSVYSTQRNVQRKMIAKQYATTFCVVHQNSSQLMKYRSSLRVWLQSSGMSTQCFASSTSTSVSTPRKKFATIFHLFTLYWSLLRWRKVRHNFIALAKPIVH